MQRLSLAIITALLALQSWGCSETGTTQNEPVASKISTAQKKQANHSEIAYQYTLTSSPYTFATLKKYAHLHPQPPAGIRILTAYSPKIAAGFITVVNQQGKPIADAVIEVYRLHAASPPEKIGVIRTKPDGLAQWTKSNDDAKYRINISAPAPYLGFALILHTRDGVAVQTTKVPALAIRARGLNTPQDYAVKAWPLACVTDDNANQLPRLDLNVMSSSAPLDAGGKTKMYLFPGMPYSLELQPREPGKDDMIGTCQTNGKQTSAVIEAE